MIIIITQMYYDTCIIIKELCLLACFYHYSTVRLCPLNVLILLVMYIIRLYSILTQMLSSFGRQN